MLCIERLVKYVIFAVILNLLMVSYAVAADNDFTSKYGDGTSDILFQDSEDGRILIWEMNNFARTLHFPKPIASSWDVVGKGNFDGFYGGDTCDIFYMRDFRQTAVAEMYNASLANLLFPGGVNPAWSMQAIGDFNGDGGHDILWRRSTDQVTMIWEMGRFGHINTTFPGGLASSWQVSGIGDFDDDGTDDILFQRSSDGRLLIWKISNFTRESLHFPTSMDSTWAVKGIGDFNADGTDDIFYVKDTGDTAIAEFTNLNRSSLKFPGRINPVWNLKDIGDYNGDGTDDVLWRRSSDHMTMIWGVNNSARNIVSFPGALSVQWKVQGDGIDDDDDAYTVFLGDCNDNDPSINPDAIDVCGDGVDQNCSGSDETCPTSVE